MIEYNLSALDKALIEHFHAQAGVSGFDGVSSLSQTDRGVLAVADLVRRQTVVQVCESLHLNGEDAARLWFHLSDFEPPLSDGEARSALNELVKAR
ncbi:MULTISPECIES: hypothetical protein [Burkholderia]|uniref:Uncharacterized protein n=3 Tax=Bacteria TaxID=2 RepID=A0A6P2SNE4_9BURK|nr:MULTISPECIES: hypothetical protein [Burkholderia]ELK7724812.1 hypothetical protein [Burkholderia cenocepacia]UTP27777.1 hypothetical protein NMB33_40540 [Burkholderia sp. FXe9]HBN6128647.1 hypothetical protein [Clostridioides difficile]MBH9693727.1 hypothetical protein [Burkholderia contaminans]MBK1905484.1 hypothetical protein [Burkholderia contaminans]